MSSISYVLCDVIDYNYFGFNIIGIWFEHKFGLNELPQLKKTLFINEMATSSRLNIQVRNELDVK